MHTDRLLSIAYTRRFLAKPLAEYAVFVVKRKIENILPRFGLSFEMSKTPYAFTSAQNTCYKLLYSSRLP